MTVTLITGSRGFIGKHILDVLSQDTSQEIHAVSRSLPTNPIDGVKYHQVDLLDIEATKTLISDVKPQNLIHLAWDARPGKFWTSEDNLRWVSASLSLFNEFCVNDGKRFVGAGSCAEYAWNESILREGVTPYIPSTLYGAAKNGLRDMLEKSAKHRDISFAWGHVFFLFGPGEQLGKFVSSAVDTFQKGEIFKTTLGYQLRDFMYVKDIAGAFVALMKSDVTGAVNIASGKQIALREMLIELADAIEGTADIDFGAMPYRDNEPMALGACTERLKNEVCFEPKFDLKSAVQDYLNCS